MTAPFPLVPVSQRTAHLHELFVARIQAAWTSLEIEWPVVKSLSLSERPEDEAELQVRKWILSALSGNGQAFQEIVLRYQNLISRRMWKFTRDRTAHEELVQDVFVECFLCLAKYRGDAPFEHWLQTLATRIGYRYWKSRGSDVTLTDEQLRSLACLETTRVRTAQEAAELLHYLLAQLPHADRLVITLLSLEGYSVAEAARQIGWNQTLVKVRAHRARRKLEALWKRIEALDVGADS